MNFELLPRFKKHQFRILEMIPKWIMLYEVDIVAIQKQIVAAHVWYDANPTRAPKKDVVRGLHAWMRIAKEFGHFTPKTKPALPYREPAHVFDMTAEEMREIRLRNFPAKSKETSCE